jgi:hypothetical protein
LSSFSKAVLVYPLNNDLLKAARDTRLYCEVIFEWMRKTVRKKILVNMLWHVYRSKQISLLCLLIGTIGQDP